MKLLLALMVALGLGGRAQAQDFLHDYQRFLRRNLSGPRGAQRAELTLLAELFTAHQRQTGRRFNEADTIHILTETPSEIINGYAPYAGMVWNRTDTIAFTLEHDSARRTVHYEPFLTPCQAPISNCSRQVLARLVAAQRFDAAKQLAQANRGFDGSNTQVVSATRTPKGYRIVSLTLPAFMLPLTDKQQFR